MTHPKRLGALAVTGALVFSCAAPISAFADSKDANADAPIAHEQQATDEANVADEATTAAPADAQAAPTALLATQANAIEYNIRDTSYNLETVYKSNQQDFWNTNPIGDATTLKIGTGEYRGVPTGNVTIPAKVAQIIGWEFPYIGDGGSESIGTIGNINKADDSLTFESGATIEIRSIKFDMNADKLTIPAGANITFKNCTFANEIVIEKGGKATFESCTFTSDTIKNNGTAQYTGSTSEPKNTGQAESTFQNLALTASETALANAMHNHAYSYDVPLNLTGTNAADAQLAAMVDDDSFGVKASVQDGTLHLEGTPAKSGTLTATVTATAPGETGGTESSSATVTLDVSQEYTLVTEGSFDPIRVSQSFNDANYTSRIKVFVEDEAGTKTSLNAWSSDDYKLTAVLDPAIAGVDTSAFNAGGEYSISLTGTPTQPANSALKLALSYHGATIEATSVPVRVYAQNVSLSSALETINGQPSSWDMDPTR